MENNGLNTMFADEVGGIEIEKSKLLKKLQSMVYESYEARSDVHERWLKNEKLFSNNPPKQKNTRSDIKYGIAMAVVYDEMPNIQDGLPVIDVVGDSQNDTFFADMINRRVRQLLENSDFSSKYTDAILDGHIYNTGLIEIMPILGETKDGKGETLKGLDIENYDIMGYFPDPMGDGWDISGKSRYVILAQLAPVKAVEAQYDLEPGTIRGGGFEVTDFKSFIDTEAYLHKNTSHLKEIENAVKNYTVVFKVYWNCVDSLSEAETEDEMDESVDELKKNYENGRCTIFCENNILYDDEIEFPMITLFGYKNYGKKNKLWGTSEVELAASGNFMANWIASNIADNIEDFGNPKRKIKRGKFRSMVRSLESSRNVEVNDKDDVTYLDARNIPSSTFNAWMQSKDMTDLVVGLQGIARGETPTGIQSGIAIRALYEATQGRIRYKIDHDIKPQLKKIGKLVAWFVQNYDKEIVDIRGQLNAKGEYDFYQYDPSDRVYSENEKSYVKYKEGSDVDKTDVVTLKDTRVNIKIEPGRGGAKGRAARSLENMELMNAGLIPYHRWVADTDLPDKADLIKWHDMNNTTKQMMLQFQKIGKKIFGQKKVADISLSGVENETIRLLQELVDMDLSKI